MTNIAQSNNSVFKYLVTYIFRTAYLQRIHKIYLYYIVLLLFLQFFFLHFCLPHHFSFSFYILRKNKQIAVHNNGYGWSESAVSLIIVGLWFICGFQFKIKPWLLVTRRLMLDSKSDSALSLAA